MSLPAQAEVKSVVLVHGAFADRSGWKPVADILLHDGFLSRAIEVAALIKKEAKAAK